MISIVRDITINEFLKNASPFLYKSEAEHGLILGLAENILHGRLTPKEPPVFLSVIENNKTIAVALQTPPFKMLMTSMTTQQVHAFAKYLKNESLEIPGFFAPISIANDLNHSLNKTPKVTEVLKLYKLDRVIAPKGSGQLQTANIHTVDLLAQWYREFSIESSPPDEIKSESTSLEHMRNFIEQKAAYILVDNEIPVTMAIVNRTTKHGATIAFVYTPPHLRKAGYASLLVAKLSQHQLDLGKSFCVLYADAINPTSNKIYQRIGYNWLSDSALVLY